MNENRTTYLTIALCFLAALFALAMSLISRPARGDTSGTITRTLEAITQLQTAVEAPRALSLANRFVIAGQETGIDPLLLVAITMRESSFLLSVEEGVVVGALGERGLMQNHGVALRFRPRDCSEYLEGARCQIETGSRYLAWVQNHCQGSTWRWVAAYGHRRCPSEEAARTDRSARVAYRYYQEVGGTLWDE